MDRVVWRKGGIRGSSGVWVPELGKTGFYKKGPHYLHRLIEEPNPLSLFLRPFLKGDCYCEVDGVEHYLTTYEDVIDHVLDQAKQHHFVSVYVHCAPHYLVDAWLVLRPRGRMAPRETWIVDASEPGLAGKEIIDD